MIPYLSASRSCSRENCVSHYSLIVEAFGFSHFPHKNLGVLILIIFSAYQQVCIQTRVAIICLISRRKGEILLLHIREHWCQPQHKPYSGQQTMDAIMTWIKKKI
ncbi:Hypothetical predicted protein [Olea europaea subsp. europaea]|uniref:Uncharacterized protein n=1 Tax=Olea europaea subsp. europaea TaxID=158383 RepID=A0A8S0QJC4_OLEEU|nr:Hypothetical predicted protein [Olea europaea subsp. europaea]